MNEKNYRKALPLLLEHHAAVHSRKLGGRWSYQDEVLGPLTETQYRVIPTGGQSVIWKIWHITRIEDLTINLLLAGAKHSLLNGKWLERLGIDYVDVGNGMPEAATARISRLMNAKALLAYRLAVGKRTQSILMKLKSQTLWEKPAPERLQRIVDEKGVRENAAWLLKFWGGNPNANLLL
ncbi:MAG: DinB family protein, partial [Anaerolineales bacterium]